MTWAYLKLILAITLPLSTLVYARQLRLEDDRRRVEWTVQQPTDVNWTFAHPRQALQQDRAEVKYLRRLLDDLNEG